MTARVLVVDDVVPNVKLLEAKLTSEYYEVIVAYNGLEALEKVEQEMPDIVLLDVMMPGMDGFEVCRRIKDNAKIAHIPVVMITALTESSDRVCGLEAGADDFLAKPVDDIALFARVRSLVRLKAMTDELRVREQTGNQYGVVAATTERSIEVGDDARILVIEDSDADAAHMHKTLSELYQVMVEPDCTEAMVLARGGDFDLIIVSLSHAATDPLRVCSQMRTNEETRQVPILTVVDEFDQQRLVKALELGVNDYLVRPIDRNELLARSLTQLRRKRYQDKLRQNYHLSLTMAVTDGLTGLYNRRYLNTHLDNLLEQLGPDGKPFSVILVDIDHFKQINDTHGHGAGDEVLREFSKRVQRSIRGVDLVARIGGEEFVVVMPDTGLGVAYIVAERLRQAVAERSFAITTDGLSEISVTSSFGVAEAELDMSSSDLFSAADEALYEAKRGGRNQVVTRGVPPDIDEDDIRQAAIM